jgi:hypothetical protein
MDQDHFIAMDDYRNGYRPACEHCGGQLVRVIVPVAEVGTGNRLHYMVDRTLNPGAEPTVFTTRRDWEDAMKRQNVRPAEPGDARAQVENTARRAKECREKYIREQSQKIDAAIDRAMQERGSIPS